MTLSQSYLFKEDELRFTDKMVEGQIQAYKMDEKKTPSLADLTSKDYLPETPVCPDGSSLEIDAEGKVKVAKAGG